MAKKIDFRSLKIHVPILIPFLFQILSAQAGKLSIVIDDVGYRSHEEIEALQMPEEISMAVLPHAPYTRRMAILAHNQKHEVLIHMPMAPFGKQSLEKDTLKPEMSSKEIQRIIRNAINNVPYAVGMNNHMGSAMTSSLVGMRKVMRALICYQIYFLDSLTISNSQVNSASIGTGVKVIARKVFLDNTKTEADIRYQFNRAVHLARRYGSAIAIGHPRPATIKVLRQMVHSLPPDTMLVKPSSLIYEINESSCMPLLIEIDKDDFRGDLFKYKRIQNKENVRIFSIFSGFYRCVVESRLVEFIKKLWD